MAWAPSRPISGSLAGQKHHKLSEHASARKAAQSSPCLETPLNTSPQSLPNIAKDHHLLVVGSEASSFLFGCFGFLGKPLANQVHPT